MSSGLEETVPALKWPRDRPLPLPCHVTDGGGGSGEGGLSCWKDTGKGDASLSSEVERWVGILQGGGGGPAKTPAECQVGRDSNTSQPLC